MTKKEIIEKIPYKLLLVFLVLSAFISVGGYVLYDHQRTQTVSHIKEDLNTIARLKSEEITGWRRERYGDAYVIARSQQFASSVRRWYMNSGDKKLKNYIYKRLDAFRIYETYKDVILVDPNGKARMFIDQQGSESLSQATLDIANQAEKQNRIIFSDFYYCEKCQEVHLDVITPLHDEEINVGALILRINPDKYLYPLIQKWPYVSKSGETVLVRKEGNEIVYLNDLRHQKGAAMKLRLPMDDVLLPAARAARGEEGLVEGRDYRGVPVVAAVKHITDSPWYMVAKVDKGEIYAPLQRQARSIIFVTVLTVMVLAAVLSFIWQADRRGFYKRQYQLELDKQVLVKHFDYLTKYANDIILLSNERYKLVEVNDKAVQTYGYGREELIGRDSDIFRSKKTQTQYKGQLDVMQSEDGMVFETMHQRKDGTILPVEVSARPIEIEGKRYLQEIVRDISERKHYEMDIRERNQKLGEANRGLEILNQCSFELASMPSGKPAYDVLTRYLKEITGGYAVSFGEYDRGAKEIAVKQILMDAKLLSKVERILGRPLIDVRSPVNPQTYDLMISEGVGVRHTLNEITFGAIPEMVSSVVGTVMGIDRYLAVVYQTEGMLYGTSVVALKHGQPEPDLAILKAFGSLGAVSLRRAQAEAKLQASHEELQASYQEIEANNQELQATEEELKSQVEALAKSEERYRTTLDSMMEGCQIIDAEGKYVYLNDNAARHGRKDKNELLGYKLKECYPGIEKTEMYSALKNCISNRVPHRMENEFAYSDGSKGWFELSIQPVPQGAFILSIDITERKKAEEQIKALKDRQEAILAAVPDIIMEVDTNKIYTWANNAGIEFYGEDVLGREAAFYFVGDQETYQNVQPLFDGLKDVVYVESWQRRKDGAKKLLAWWCRMLKDKNGKVTGALSTARDITETRKAENMVRESEKNLQAILDSVSFGVMIFGKDKRLRTANRAAVEMSGYGSVDVMKGIVCHQSICPADTGKCPILDLGQEVDKSERVLLATDGRRIPILKSVVNINMYGEELLLESFIDITELKKAEGNIRKQLNELTQWQSVTLGREDRVRELKEEVNHLLGELGRVNKYGRDHQ